MSNSVLGLSIDCADAAKLAQFWADVLGREVNPRPTTEFAAIDANGSTQGPRLAFHQVPEAKTLKNRLHLVSRNRARFTSFIEHGGTKQI